MKLLSNSNAGTVVLELEEGETAYLHIGGDSESGPWATFARGRKTLTIHIQKGDHGRHDR